MPRLNEQGVPTDLLEPQQVVAEWPDFDLDGIAVAAFERDAGHADPVLTTQGLFDRARELGADALLDRQVTGIERDGDGWTIRTSDASIAAERVLIAGGPWTRPLAAMVGADLPLTVERYIVATFAWGGDVRAPPTATCRTATTSAQRARTVPRRAAPPRAHRRPRRTSTSGSGATRPNASARGSCGASGAAARDLEGRLGEPV